MRLRCLIGWHKPRLLERTNGTRTYGCDGCGKTRSVRVSAYGRPIGKTPWEVPWE